MQGKKLKNLQVSLVGRFWGLVAASGVAFSWLGLAAAVWADQPLTVIPDRNFYEELAESFQTGNFQLWQLTDYAFYLVELLVFFAGGIAVLFIVIGGYQYMIGAVSEDKEAGKKTLGFALGGFAVCLLAWLIVSFVQSFVTSG